MIASGIVTGAIAGAVVAALMGVIARSRGSRLVPQLPEPDEHIAVTGGDRARYYSANIVAGLCRFIANPLHLLGEAVPLLLQLLPVIPDFLLGELHLYPQLIAGTLQILFELMKLFFPVTHTPTSASSTSGLCRPDDGLLSNLLLLFIG